MLEHCKKNAAPDIGEKKHSSMILIDPYSLVCCLWPLSFAQSKMRIFLTVKVLVACTPVFGGCAKA